MTDRVETNPLYAEPLAAERLREAMPGITRGDRPAAPQAVVIASHHLDRIATVLERLAAERESWPLDRLRGRTAAGSRMVGVRTAAGVRMVVEPASDEPDADSEPTPDEAVMDAVQRLVRVGNHSVSKVRLEALMTLLVVTDTPDRRPRELIATALAVLGWTADEEG